MSLAVGPETSLILSLLAAADGAGWSPFLRTLADMAAAECAALEWRLPDGAGRLARAGGERIDRRGVTSTRRAPWTDALVARLRPERVYDAQELHDLAHPATDVPGWRAARVIRADARGRAALVLGIFGARAFDAADGALLRRLHPFLQVAAARIADRAIDAARTEIARRIAPLAPSGWLLLDRGAGVVAGDLDAMALPSGARLAAGPVGERLTLGDRAAEQVLSAALEGYARGETTRDRVLWIDRDRRHALRLGRYAAAWPDATRRPVAIAAWMAPRTLDAQTGPLLGDLFGLTPSEARLALALARGATLADAADALGLTIETARTYSKQLFAKTDSRGQPDLIRRLYSTGLARADAG